jgi:hypothetical protein
MALYNDPLEAARKAMMPQRSPQSYFPAANLSTFSERDDLLKEAEGAFYGGGNVPPPPTPTPTPTPNGQFPAANNFQFPLNKTLQTPSLSRVNYFSSPVQLPSLDALEKLRAQYGWNT